MEFKFQVEPVHLSAEEGGGLSTNKIRIQFMKLWWRDVYDTVTCSGHPGDSQRNNVFVRTLDDRRDPLFGKVWWIEKTSGGVEGELSWRQNANMLRAVSFEQAPGEPFAMHPVIYFSKGKHHEYSDTAYHGRTDKHHNCSYINAYINAQGYRRCKQVGDEMLLNKQ